MQRSSAPCLLAAAFAAVLVSPAPALAYWQWRDANGHMVYSDVPPSTAAARVLRAPGRHAGDFQPVQAIQPADAAPPAPAPAKASAKPIAPTPEEAFQKRREASLKAAAEEARRETDAAERAARCAQLRNYATGLQQGMRAAVAGPDGSLQHLNSEQRQAEILKTSANLEKHCN
ncbi:DUF4124 domain-containing protein [Cupriavidus taiwanensis]|uniref:DUF4124 domain-containing protein n=1 Tax=Cupriavidus taiwanensis TaxID=164546 RepID=A0A7Z7J7X0_9BURK|nr:DUF4124 domain-containing protein [Cupriavidus taiwanensis]SOY87605.1 Conserved hypothetical protein [Cupriavidus taiwanensis]SOZ05509.1 Conserved hypothetical protein [Cupriavidus taiwanensis]SOZ07494.1 Conserved hypothetical protein [Cupriavidus taiwanensis]SPC15534.1 Conserved hypothetical protein [Cupriavidus taiwanensis]SPD40176.1 conserved exported protein of unknown function [Cupriavidus taiwanensis]